MRCTHCGNPILSLIAWVGNVNPLPYHVGCTHVARAARRMDTELKRLRDGGLSGVRADAQK